MTTTLAEYIEANRYNTHPLTSADSSILTGNDTYEN